MASPLAGAFASGPSACLKAAAGLGGSFSQPSSCEPPSRSVGPCAMLGSPRAESSLKLPVPGSLSPHVALLSPQLHIDDDGGDDGRQVQGLTRLLGPHLALVEGLVILP